MIDGVMRLLHVPWWVPFAVWFGLYIFTACGWIINGYAQEYLGWRHPGRPGKIHKVLVRFHTGSHVHPDRSHGDERRLSRAAGGTNRATPEGQMVYWDPHSRPFRAIRNNLIIIGVLTVLSLFVDDPKATVVIVTLAVLFGGSGLIALKVMKVRRKMAARRPVTRPAVTLTRRAKAVMEADTTTVGSTPKLEEDTRPQLEGVPSAVIAALLAAQMNCAVAEIMARLTLNPDRGELVLPDTFGALMRQRDPVQEVIEAHTVGAVRFDWATTATPRKLIWVPIVVHKLPDMVRFRDFLPQLEALGPRQFGVGLTADRNMYVTNHNGDNPWTCRFANAGTGKSTGFLVKAAQVCHADPLAELYCVDTKQVSFEPLHGIPRVHIYDNPQSEMPEIWKVFYALVKIMDDRYTAVREGRARFDDFHDIWLFVDEGNDLGAQLKSYWRNKLEGQTASPPIWGECIARLLRQGRQARIFGEWMFQDLTDKAMGQESLKMAFSEFGAAGFLPGQFTRTIGPPAPDCLEGPGKILMCRGNKRIWVQGFYDDEQWLHDYALERRREVAA